MTLNPIRWHDPATWERYARQDLELFLVELDRALLARTDVLEIGCGSGRLMPLLRPMVRSYTGFDIAPGMVGAARERTSGLDGDRIISAIELVDAILVRIDGDGAVPDWMYPGWDRDLLIQEAQRLRRLLVQLYFV